MCIRDRNSVEDRDNGSIITPSFTDTTDPDAVLSATITAYGVAQPLNSVNINWNNQVELYTDPAQSSGNRGAYVTNREAPSISIDPYLDLIATDPWYTRWAAGTTGAFSMTVGDHLLIDAPAMQCTSAYGSGERGGFASNSIEGILTRNAGNDELRIYQY